MEMEVHGDGGAWRWRWMNLVYLLSFPAASPTVV